MKYWKKSIYEYYDHSSTKTFRLHTKSSKPDNESVAGKMLIIEESLSIKHKNGGTNRQLYRINMFNTTSRIDVNGYWLQEFIQEDLHIICQCLEQYTDYKRLNNKILGKLASFLYQMPKEQPKIILKLVIITTQRIWYRQIYKATNLYQRYYKINNWCATIVPARIYNTSTKD
jgi:hypothetical protein